MTEMLAMAERLAMTGMLAMAEMESRFQRRLV